MIWKTGKLMVNLSVLVQKKPHLHLYAKILPITCKCKERRGRDCDNCDHNFSILGASFTDIVKNASVLSQCSDITYAGTASNYRLKYRLTMYTCTHVNIRVLCICYLQPPCTWDRGITKILTFPSAKLGHMPCIETLKRRIPGNRICLSTRA